MLLLLSRFEYNPKNWPSCNPAASGPNAEIIELVSQPKHPRPHWNPLKIQLIVTVFGLIRFTIVVCHGYEPKRAGVYVQDLIEIQKNQCFIQNWSRLPESVPHPLFNYACKPGKTSFHTNHQQCKSLNLWTVRISWPPAISPVKRTLRVDPW